MASETVGVAAYMCTLDNCRFTSSETPSSASSTMERSVVELFGPIIRMSGEDSEPIGCNCPTSCASLSQGASLKSSSRSQSTTTNLTVLSDVSFKFPYCAKQVS